MTPTCKDGLMLIDGELTAGEGGARGQWIDSHDPATLAPVGRVPAATAGDVDLAVQAAARAQIAWKSLSVWERAAQLRALAAAIRARGKEILELEARDTGNTLAKLQADIQIAAGYLEYFAGLGSELKGETIPATAQGLHLTLREPYGVVARIVPFNHPFMFAAAHLAAPLMAGNAVVVKTPETSPMTGGILGELCREVLPRGLVNVIHGHGSPAGDALVRHQLVRRIGFTGSVATGLAIQRAAAESSVKHVTLELGGKNPFIVFPDADLDRAVEMAVAGMNFSWAGQSCGSTSRLLLHESVHDEIVERIAAKLSALRLGNPLSLDSEMGPVNSARQHARVLDFIAAAKADGARLVCGGGRPPGEPFANGYWIQPTLFADVQPSMRVAREEIFGPVMCALRFATEEQAIALANDSDYGLTAAVWTRDLSRSLRVMRALEAGTVWINTAGQHYVGSPFGGWKDSGLGGEECLEELFSYSQTKAVHAFA
ncbi:MAG: aldehyde dehydrogenase family protein [Gammaproteobacteria bacterium]|nr:aldehyde dehydrogenase family protein [Gammaproteobacteria bacterium]NCW57941.1 aldehyde dehydrogenase family protein [Gammaproteobacteria bacterium]NDA43395.1 aldehyde dehydrogenase family protein [Gammaproteobacteria bacterium]NDB24833.1 aldehyde dehydrogenase family protein [Gammaproteobacteria bacterium]